MKDAIKYIDLRTVQNFLADPSGVDLSTATEISEDAAKLLSSYDPPNSYSGLFLDNISEISELSLTELIHLKEGNLSLGFTQIDASTARILSLYRGRLILKKIKALSIDAASELKGFSVYLGGIEEIDDQVAEMISNNIDYLCINGRAKFSTKAAEYLNKCFRLKFTIPITFSEDICELFDVDSLINIRRMKAWFDESRKTRDISISGSRLTKNAAKFIANRKGKKTSISFSDLDVANQFKGYQGEIGFLSSYSNRAMLGPSEEVATALAEVKGSLTIEAWDISFESAKALANFSGSELRLQFRMTSISDAIAELLSNHQGKLGLSELTELSDAAAVSLSKYQGQLNLNGLHEITDIAAEALSKHKGQLYLEGLTEISDAAAASLSKHQGEICEMAPADWVKSLKHGR